MKACTLVFSPTFSPSTTRPLGVLEGFSLQINLVSDLDAWSDFLDIPKKVFDSLPLYRVQKRKRYSLNVKLSKESYESLGISFLLFYLITCFYELFKEPISLRDKLIKGKSYINCFYISFVLVTFMS